MAEALEKWDVNLVKTIIPRIFSIIVEINNRYCQSLMEKNGYDSAKTTRMSIIKDNTIHMATLCVVASNSVNGVYKLHSEIIKQSVFHDEYENTPEKFKNVTNGSISPIPDSPSSFRILLVGSSSRTLRSSQISRSSRTTRKCSTSSSKSRSSARRALQTM